MSDLTVVIINKNSGSYISQSCLSVLSQDYKDFKIFLTDSASTDDSIEKIKLINSDKIKIFNVGSDVNHHDAWLHGIKNVESKYITFMTTTDGYVDNQWFSTAISELENDESLSFVYANSIQRKNNENLNDINQKFFLKFNIPSHESFYPFYLATNYHINELNCVWSTQVVKNLLKHKGDNLTNFDGSNAAIDLFETLEFLAVKNGFLGKYINTIANYGREHDNSLTAKYLMNSNIIKKRREIILQRRKALFQNIKDKMIFQNRNFEEVSKINKITFFNFYISFLVYSLFFPQYKKQRPLYSLNYLFIKFKTVFFENILLKIIIILLKKLQNIKFYKSK